VAALRLAQRRPGADEAVPMTLDDTPQLQTLTETL
jgi:hypothetical protein